MQVFDALLSDFLYDWLNNLTYDDINQSYMVLEGSTALRVNDPNPKCVQFEQIW